MAIGWLLDGYWMAIGWLLDGCQVAIGWVPSGYWMGARKSSNRRGGTRVLLTTQRYPLPITHAMPCTHIHKASPIPRTQLHYRITYNPCHAHSCIIVSQHYPCHAHSCITALRFTHATHTAALPHYVISIPRTQLHYCIMHYPCHAHSCITALPHYVLPMPRTQLHYSITALPMQHTLALTSLYQIQTQANGTHVHRDSHLLPTPNTHTHTQHPHS